MSNRLRAAMRSVRSCIARDVAPARSTACSWNGAVSVGLRFIVQKSGVARIENQRAQPILGLADGRLRQDHRLFAAGHFGFSLDDVDGRQRADLDARSGVAERLLREVERLLGDGQRVDREDVVPVGVLDGTRRERHGLPQADVGDLAVLPRLVDLLADRVELEVPEQRLAHLHVDVAAQLRVETAENVVAVEAGTVPRRRSRWCRT